MGHNVQKLQIFAIFSSDLLLRPRTVDFTDGGFFSDLFNAVSRSKIKNKIIESNIFFRFELIQVGQSVKFLPFIGHGNYI